MTEQKRAEVAFRIAGIALAALHLREIEEKYSLILQFAECFCDHRNPEKTEHSVRELLAQRVVGLCHGYEDLNDHEELRKDPLLADGAGGRLSGHHPGTSSEGGR